MAKITMELFHAAAYELGMLARLTPYEQFGERFLFAIAILGLVIGCKVYKVYFSTIMFITVAIVSCLLLTNTSSWGSIVTCFSVLGSVLAFFAYKWVHLGACIIAALVIGAIGYMYTYNIYLAVALAIVAIIFTIYFPLVSSCMATTIWGSFVAVELYLNAADIFIIIPLSVAGFLFQMFISKKQTYFKNPYPPKLVYWFKNKRRRKEATKC